MTIPALPAMIGVRCLFANDCRCDFAFPAERLEAEPMPAALAHRLGPGPRDPSGQPDRRV